MCCGLFSSPEYTQAHSFDDPYIPENTKGGPLHGNCCWECSPILEPIEPVQEEESSFLTAANSYAFDVFKDVLPHDYEKDFIDKKGDAIGDFLLGAKWAKNYLESTVSRLKSEIEELKRKA